MPTYQYKCQNCGHTLEELQSMKEEPLMLCPNCKKPKLQRTIGTGGRTIFKGSGFYLTDYKNGNSGKKDSPKSDSKK
ncbi:MAG: zinc ribbon domain-containing protein [Bacteroidota bacterium]|nr:zinc ribbon domain-containing protein [Bacteroidota bacterium]